MQINLQLLQKLLMLLHGCCIELFSPTPCALGLVETIFIGKGAVRVTLFELMKYLIIALSN